MLPLVDMIKMFSLIFLFFVLMFSFVFFSLINPRCFLGLRKKTCCGDKEIVFFSIYTVHGHVKIEHFINNLYKKHILLIYFY